MRPWMGCIDLEKNDECPESERGESVINEAPRAERVEWALSQNFYPSSAIDPNGFGLYAVLFWASGTQ